MLPSIHHSRCLAACPRRVRWWGVLSPSRTFLSVAFSSCKPHRGPSSQAAPYLPRGWERPHCWLGLAQGLVQRRAAPAPGRGPGTGTRTGTGLLLGSPEASSSCSVKVTPIQPVTGGRAKDAGLWGCLRRGLCAEPVWPPLPRPPLASVPRGAARSPASSFPGKSAKPLLALLIPSPRLTQTPVSRLLALRSAFRAGPGVFPVPFSYPTPFPALSRAPPGVKHALELLLPGFWGELGTGDRRSA